VLDTNEAGVAEDAPLANEVGEYVEKYRESIVRTAFDPEGFARTYSAVPRVRPER
jgi:hypothetical protein